MKRVILKQYARLQCNHDWVWEVLILVTVTPALAHGLLSLQNLPVA